MADAYPIPTPDQLQAGEIMDSAKRAMMDEVHSAVVKAATNVRRNLAATDVGSYSEILDYFYAVVHQNMYLKICDANVETFEGGNIRKAIEIVRNQQQIANHYWGADIAVTPPA